MRKVNFLLPAILLVATFVAADQVEAKAKNGIQLKNAVITAIDTTTETITATKNDVSYTIDASNATFRRKYGAKCDVYELMTGDHIYVWGAVSGLNITANKVKDYSIQKWKGTFAGTITYIDSLNTYSDNEGRVYRQFEIQSNHRGTQVIRVYDTTRIKYKKTSKTFDDLAVGQKIFAKGIWNSTHSFVYDTNWVKIRNMTASN
jgi:hypothetical protein